MPPKSLTGEFQDLARIIIPTVLQPSESFPKLVPCIKISGPQLVSQAACSAIFIWSAFILRIVSSRSGILHFQPRSSQIGPWLLRTLHDNYLRSLFTSAIPSWDVTRCPLLKLEVELPCSPCSAFPRKLQVPSLTSMCSKEPRKHLHDERYCVERIPYSKESSDV